MRRLTLSAIIFVVAVILVGTAEAAETPTSLRWSGGLGMEVRGQQEINPQYMEARVLPHFFAHVRRFPFAVAIEGGYEQRETNSGQLSIATKTIGLGVWGRYEFRDTMRWAPFASVGVGSYLDTISLNYGDGEAATARKGRRDFAGLGGGIGHVVWNHFLHELETRAVLIEDRRDVAWTFIYRMGYVY